MGCLARNLRNDQEKQQMGNDATIFDAESVHIRPLSAPLSPQVPLALKEENSEAQPSIKGGWKMDFAIHHTFILILYFRL